MKFRLPVRWPANVSIDANGLSEISFHKKRHINWEKDSIRVINETEEPLADVFPKYWMLEVIDNENITHDTCLLSLRYVNDAYHLFGVGRHFTIRQKIKSKCFDSFTKLLI